MHTPGAEILATLNAAATAHQDWQQLELSKAPALHIAVMSEPFLEYVLSGKKIVESRFSLHHIAPYQQVQAGDIVLMKAGPVIGGFVVAWTRYFDLNTTNINDIANNYGSAMCADATFWKSKADKRYATLMGITRAQLLTPITIPKRDRRGWLTLLNG